MVSEKTKDDIYKEVVRRLARINMWGDKGQVHNDIPGYRLKVVTHKKRDGRTTYIKVEVFLKGSHRKVATLSMAGDGSFERGNITMA